MKISLKQRLAFLKFGLTAIWCGFAELSKLRITFSGDTEATVNSLHSILKPGMVHLPASHFALTGGNRPVFHSMTKK
jgi:hypothetical protein